MDGRLRSDLVTQLNDAKCTADLVIVMGTSLSGVAADALVSTVGRKRLDFVETGRRAAAEAQKTLGRVAEDEHDEAIVTSTASTSTTAGSVLPTGEGLSEEKSPALGSVIINVQQTRLDGLAALRIFATCDEVSKLLASELDLTVATSDTQASSASAKGSDDDVWRALPYSPSTAERLPEGESRDAVGSLHQCTTLDLRPGRRVKLARGNAPMAPAGLEGAITGKTAQGHYTIAFDDGNTRCLGTWMLDAAREGRLDMLPLLNVNV